MASKITITITPDMDYLDRDSANANMAETMALLATLNDAPSGKIVLTIECRDEDVRDLKSDIHAALSGRPVGIEVNLKSSDLGDGVTLIHSVSGLLRFKAAYVSGPPSGRPTSGSVDSTGSRSTKR